MARCNRAPGFAKETTAGTRRIRVKINRRMRSGIWSFAVSAEMLLAIPAERVEHIEPEGGVNGSGHLFVGLFLVRRRHRNSATRLSLPRIDRLRARNDHVAARRQPGSRDCRAWSRTRHWGRAGS